MVPPVKIVLGCLTFSLLVLGIAGCGAVAGLVGGGPNLTITVSASKTTLQAGDLALLGANVTHSGGNPAVTWSLSGTTCPNNCGALSSTQNGETFTAPQFVSATFTVTVTATAVADTSKSASVTIAVNKSVSIDCPSGSESTLNGQYAFFLHGGGKPGLVTIVGSLTADGKGNITAGLEDINGNNSGPQTGLTIPSNASLYSVGSDNRGCLALVNSQNTTTIFRFALAALSGGVATTGRMIEFDDTTGNGTRAEGFLAKQDPSSFGTSDISGHYAFGLEGPDSSLSRIVSAGVIDASAGGLSSGNTDSDDSGVVTSNVTGITGTYNVASDGRGTLTLSTGGGSNFVLYMVSAAQFLAMSTDALSASHPIQSGQFFAQTLNSFDSTSLNAAAVISLSGFDTASAGPIASVGLITPNGTGSANIVLDENDAGTYTSAKSSALTYSVSANGRTTLSGLTQNPVFYLISQNQGLVVGTDSAATFGSFEPQTGAPFSNSLLSGTYSYGTEGTDVGHRLTAVGALTFDGVTNDQATEDQSTPAGLNPNAPLPNNQYSFSSSSVPPGRGTLDTLGDSIAYIISPTKMVYINPPATEPRLVIVEK